MGRAEGTGDGAGSTNVEGAAVAGGMASCCFLCFLWIIGLPVLFAGIGLVTAFNSGYVIISEENRTVFKVGPP